MQFQLLTLITLASATLANEFPTAPGALAEYNRIITLAEAARNTSAETGVEARQCNRLDPCCPNGGDSCVEDMCSLGDGINFVGCLLGCCVACGKGGRYC
ncbi:hypothetical protein OQA88_10761 [Cercophora sp. LCS_1]